MLSEISHIDMVALVCGLKNVGLMENESGRVAQSWEKGEVWGKG